MTDKRILALENEADALRSQGRHAEAIEKMKAALEIDEKFVRGHLALAVLYNSTQQYDLACHHGERACELEPADTFNFVALSVTYQRAFEGTRDPQYIQKAEYAKARSHGM